MEYAQRKKQSYLVQRKSRSPSNSLRSNVNVIEDPEKFKKTTGVDPLAGFNPYEAIVKAAQETAKRGEEWKPITVDLCPSCEAEQGGGDGPPPPPMPTEPPPKVVELKPPPPRKGKGGKKEQEEEKEDEGKEGGEGEEEEKKKKGEDEDEQGEEEDKGEEEDEGEEDKDEEPEKPPVKPLVNPEDVEKAKEGSDDVQREFEDATHIRDDQITSAFQPVTSAADPSLYRDSNFISKMNTALRDWKTGWKEFVGKTGSRLSVPEYIRSRGEEPFVTTLKKSAHGRKILVVADFSASMSDRQEDYKKAIVSSMEVLDGIGSQTALYGFGGETGGDEVFFFKVKRFEDPKWKPIHSSKTAALAANGSTPTAEAYKGLEQYVKRHRPDVTVTITDGAPDEPIETANMIRNLKRHTRMVAFGIGADPASAHVMEDFLKRFGYNRVFSVDNIHNIPPKLVRLMTPE